MSQTSIAPLPRRTPGAAFADTVLGPRPAPPKQRLHAEMNPKLRDLDWNGHVPTAPMRTVADWGSDDDKPAIPTVPRQRQASDLTTWDAADIYERPAAWNAFGSAA